MELPRTAQLCAQLCNARLENLREKLPSKIAAANYSSIVFGKKMKKTVAEFAESVQLYRNVVMDSITNSHLREQHHLQHLIDTTVQQIRDQQRTQDLIEHLQKEYTAQVTELKQFAVQGFAQNNERMRAGLDHLLSRMQTSELKMDESDRRAADTSRLAEQLREIAVSHQSIERTITEGAMKSPSLAISHPEPRSERDRFSFSATIVGSRDGRIEHTAARAKMDTGCDDNWISEDLLIRAGLMGLMEPVDSEEIFVGFGGAEFKPLGAMKITWFRINTSKSWKDYFLVHRDGPFDMVLGGTWITENGLLTLSQPAMALRMTNFTKGKYMVSRQSLQTPKSKEPVHIKPLRCDVLKNPPHETERDS
ncbi:MAG: hypothetical protein Q9204_003986 [Flavoplaca sp. TL-2023a]